MTTRYEASCQRRRTGRPGCRILRPRKAAKIGGHLGLRHCTDVNNQLAASQHAGKRSSAPMPARLSGRIEAALAVESGSRRASEPATRQDDGIYLPGPPCRGGPAGAGDIRAIRASQPTRRCRWRAGDHRGRRLGSRPTSALAREHRGSSSPAYFRRGEHRLKVGAGPNITYQSGLRAKSLPTVATDTNFTASESRRPGDRGSRRPQSSAVLSPCPGSANGPHHQATRDKGPGEPRASGPANGGPASRRGASADRLRRHLAAGARC